MKEICLFSKPFTINITWRIVCKNYWKTIWISHHGWLLSLKMCYFEKSLNILFWNWKKYTAIIKWISVTFISKWLHFDFQTIHRSPRNLKVSTVINYLQGMEIWRAHVSQCFWFTDSLIFLDAIGFFNSQLVILHNPFWKAIPVSSIQGNLTSKFELCRIRARGAQSGPQFVASSMQFYCA